MFLTIFSLAIIANKDRLSLPATVNEVRFKNVKIVYKKIFGNIHCIRCNTSSSPACCRDSTHCSKQILSQTYPQRDQGSLRLILHSRDLNPRTRCVRVHEKWTIKNITKTYPVFKNIIICITWIQIIYINDNCRSYYLKTSFFIIIY